MTATKEEKKAWQKVLTPRYDEVYFKAIEAMDRDDNPLINLPTPVFRHTSAADEQAFGKLYDALQEAKSIVHRGIREGERGHKKALHDAARVLGEVT